MIREDTHTTEYLRIQLGVTGKYELGNIYRIIDQKVRHLLMPAACEVLTLRMRALVLLSKKKRIFVSQISEM